MADLKIEVSHLVNCLPYPVLTVVYHLVFTFLAIIRVIRMVHRKRNIYFCVQLLILFSTTHANHNLSLRQYLWTMFQFYSHF